MCLYRRRIWIRRMLHCCEIFSKAKIVWRIGGSYLHWKLVYDEGQVQVRLQNRMAHLVLEPIRRDTAR